MADPNYNPNAALQTPGTMGGGYNPNPDPIIAASLNAPQGTISSSTLAPTPSPNYTAPAPTPLYPSSAVVNPYALTAPQEKAQSLNNDIQGLNTSIANKAADTTALYKQYGFNTTTDANGNIVADPGTADLSAKLTALQNEALAIPQQLQLDATGRGITTGGLQPIQTAALRNNSIAALGVGSLIAAKNGQLETAKHYVDAALTQKYGPLEAELKAKTANLQLIMNSPEYTNAEKQQAAQQAQNIAKQQAALDKQKSDQQAAQTAVVNIIASNPSVPQNVLTQLGKATNPVDVATIAASAGLNISDSGLPASAQEYQFAVKNGYKGTYTQYQNEDANRKRSIAAAGVANSYGMNAKETAIFNSIVDKQNNSPLVAANDRAVILRDITSQLEKDPSNASLQVSFIYSMIQALDTYQSAVREGEIGLISSTQGLGDQIQNLPSKIQNGTPLSANKVKEYINTARVLTDSIAGAADKKRRAFAAQANIAGVGPAFNDYLGAVSGNPPQGGSDPLKITSGNPLGI